MTRVRLAFARLLYFLFHMILRQDRRVIQRKGVFYEVDLTGGYILNEQQIKFEQIYDYFETLKYSLFNSKKGKKITLQNFTNQIPLRATTDIIAIPPKSFR